MADMKKVDVKKVAEEAKKQADTVKTAAGKAAEKATETAKTAKTAKKQVEIVAEETKKQVETVAEETKKATETAKKTVKKAATTAKKATKKAEVTKSAVLQFGGEDFKVDEIIANAEAAFKAENKRKTISDIKVYIKPEERAAYYVVTSGSSEYAGRIDL